MHAAALDGLLRSNGPAGPPAGPPLTRLLRHDRRQLRRLVRQVGRVDLDTGVLAAIATVATLCRPASEGQARALRERLPDLLGGMADGAIDEYVTWLARIYPGPFTLNTLRPDPLGEHMVAATLTAEPSIIVRLGTACTDDQIVNALTVLGRAMHTQQELAAAVTALIRVNSSRLIMLGIDAAERLEEPEPFVRALAAAISDNQLSADSSMVLLHRLSTAGPALNPLKATAHRVFSDVVAKPMGALTRPTNAPELVPFVTAMDRLTTFVQDALQGFIDPGSGTMPKGPDGSDIVPASLLNALRQIVVNHEWFPPDDRDRG